MDSQDRERLKALEIGFDGLKKSVDLLRQEGREGRALLRQEVRENLKMIRDGLSEYVRHERYIWIERTVIAILAGFVGFGINSVVAS